MGKSIGQCQMIYLRNHNQILTDVALRLNLTEDIGKADKIVLWNDVMGLERSIANLGKMSGKKVITVQHGRRGTSRYFSPFNESIVSDKLCVWGELDKKRLVEAGHPANKIVVTGTPIFKFLKPRIKHKGTNVVFCPEHWDYDVQENTDVSRVLRRMDVKMITKIIAGQDKKKYLNTVYSDRTKPGHLEKCIEVLQTADLVVGISESTFEK